MNKLLTILLLLCLASSATAQIPGIPNQQQEIQLQQFLTDRNIDETELRQRLASRGIRADNLTPQQVLQIRPQIEAVIAEMQADKKAAEQAAKKAASESTKAINEAVDDGASLEEAITEVTTQAAGEELPASNIYGHQVFRNKSLQVYRATKNATPPESYPLKAGDEIAVSIFGASQTDFILRLDDQGFVKLGNGYRMPLGGIPLGKARTLLANRLRQFYTFRDGQLSIRIQAVRTISVNIFGEVENNGSFAMSSLNTGFNALVAAGGPTNRGTVRNIQLIQGEKTTILDVYEYLRSPTEGTALFLNNNSTIFVPLAEKIITLIGGVERPLRYELKTDETLSDLLVFAGGTSARAETSSIQVTRYVGGMLELINVDLKENPNFMLLDEDMVNVPVIENPVENFVTIEGAVLLPGRYSFSENTTLADLLTHGRLRPGARTDVAFLFRNNDDGTQALMRVQLGADAGADKVELQRGDRLQVLAKSAFNDRSVFTVTGAVRDSAITMPFPEDGALTLEEAVLLAGGAEPNATPEVMLVRTPVNNQEQRRYKRLDLRDAGDFPLQPLDRVIVYSQERFNDQATVSISGAVRAQGIFTYDASLTLRDLVYLAGGTRIDAAPDRVDVFRLQIDEGVQTKTLSTTIDLNAGVPYTLQPYDEVVVRSAAEFELIQNITIEGEVRYPGTYALLEDNERLTDVVRRAGGLTNEAFPAGATLYRGDKGVGYVILDLDEVITEPGNSANMVLLGGDTLFIPKKRELVTIHTLNTLADRFGVDSTTIDGTMKVAFRGEKSAAWYINNYAGGFNDDTARKRWTTVEYASGGVKETKSFMGLRSYPKVQSGASIRVATVPTKKQKERREERFNWIGLTSVILGALGTVATLWIVASRN